MSDDVLSRIDATLEAAAESMARNAARFDPFGGWPTHGIGEAMRWQPEKPAEKPAAPVAAASPYLTRQDITGQPDRIAEAFRAEVVRQGLDVDGISDTFVPLRVALRPDAAEQVEALRPAIDTMSLECATGGPERCRGCDGRTAGRGDGPCRHDCHGIEWRPQFRPTLDDDLRRAGARLQAALDAVAPRRPWWKRWFR